MADKYKAQMKVGNTKEYELVKNGVVIATFHHPLALTNCTNIVVLLNETSKSQGKSHKEPFSPNGRND